MMYWYFFWEKVNELKEEEKIKGNDNGTLEISKIPHINYKINEGRASGEYYEWYGTIEDDFIVLRKIRDGLVFNVPKGYAEDDKMYYLNATLYIPNIVFSFQLKGKLIDRYCTYNLVKKYYGTESCEIWNNSHGEEEACIKICKDTEDYKIEEEYFKGIYERAGWKYK